MTLKGISMSDNITTHLQEWTTKSVVNRREQFSFWSDAICEKIFQLTLGDIKVDRPVDKFGVGDQLGESLFQVADIGLDVLTDKLDHNVGELDVLLFYFFCEYGYSSLVVRGL